MSPDQHREMEHEARKFHGLFAGQFEPEEYAPFILAGVLRKTWNGTSGLIGLAKLEIISTRRDVTP